jgi:hypothetical protein
VVDAAAADAVAAVAVRLVAVVRLVAGCLAAAVCIW